MQPKTEQNPLANHEVQKSRKVFPRPCAVLMAKGLFISGNAVWLSLKIARVLLSGVFLVSMWSI